MERLVSQTNPQTRSRPTPPRRRLERVGTTARGKSPQYLSKRATTYYFVRKIPADALEAFPGRSSLVTKSLGTPLLEKAKVLLAVEVTEFDLTLANRRRRQAAESAEQADASLPRLDRLALVDQTPVLSPQEQERLDLVRTLEANLERLRSMTAGARPARMRARSPRRSNQRETWRQASRREKPGPAARPAKRRLDVRGTEKSSRRCFTSSKTGSASRLGRAPSTRWPPRSWSSANSTARCRSSL
jgi:hypothetical protein